MRRMLPYSGRLERVSRASIRRRAESISSAVESIFRDLQFVPGYPPPAKFTDSGTPDAGWARLDSTPRQKQNL
jgi:hypothetical protein